MQTDTNLSDSALVPVPAFRACRQAARAVRSAQLRRQAIATVRPRGVALFRSGAPLSVLIRLAALEDRLVWRSPDAFAVLEAPSRQAWLVRDGRRHAPGLRFLNRYWDMLISWRPVALVVGVGLALLPVTRIAALVAALVAMVWAVVMMGTVVVTGFVRLYRILIMGRVRDLGAEPIGQLCGLHWSIPLLHAGRAPDAAELAGAVARHISRLVYDTSPDAAGAAPGHARCDVVLCLDHASRRRRLATPSARAPV